MGFKTKAGNFINKVFGKDIVVEVNGVAYSNFLSVDVNRSLETIANEFTVIGTVEKLEDFPIVLGDDVVILFHEVSILDGYVEIISSEYSNDGHTVTISGRDRTSDIVDGTVFNPLVITGSMTLKALLTKLLSDNGVGNINVIDLVRPDIFTKKDQVNSDQGESLFSDVDRYCAKRQVRATTDGEGNLVVTRGGEGVEYSQKIIHNYSPFLASQNNVLSASKYESTFNRYNKYIVKSQNDVLGLVSGGSGIDVKKDTNQDGESSDSEIRPSRVLTIVDETAGDSDYSKKRAEWESSVRKARGFSYSCKVQGFLVDDSNVWTPNCLVSVTDQRLNVDDTLLIKDVYFSYSVDQGSITELIMVKKDSYQMAPDSPLSLGFLGLFS